ncbi:MAG: bifunctional folylpolyglutamate synthase/dihydrofolate synthase [Syntrophales bacterium]|jgi:dihydrofolate synthase/folylpolyglutamate synthase|nr:bifunctional folylpolyglutamate synthase/dihydrofolate synthase [Syntrophales bacterium]MCK9527892.1 bifunctional folylpolyglutamate synthase/dihydrofolate synthase [Syntrophales bacterium]MDX9921933.1 folylpolyglutamate synthase/dihydrofolate synthase family protein [Syntrophales bacterium]
MDIKTALDYLFSLENRGIHLGLGPVTELLESLGNPHRSLRTIHIAGSNGKGSVAAMIASIVKRAGYRVGLYTSPHLVCFRERIRIDGVMIGEDELARLVTLLRPRVTDELTFFEVVTALAFLHFQRHSVDVAVIETGLGGRLDATNCVVPEVSLITTISLEHERYLGRSISRIAAEKGGIIKEGGICITGATQKRALDVFESIAEERRARLIRAGRDFAARRRGEQRISYRGLTRALNDVPLPLAGGYQVKNAALALASIEILSEKGMTVDDEAIIGGMASVRWEGRLEIIDRSPLVIVDGAHNPEGVRALCRSLKNDFTWERLFVVFGVMRDKRYKTMLSLLAAMADTIIITEPQSGSDRALHLSGRETWLPVGRGTTYESVPDPEKAMLRARELADEKDLILVAGSLYLVGAVKRAEDRA